MLASQTKVNNYNNSMITSEPLAKDGQSKEDAKNDLIAELQKLPPDRLVRDYSGELITAGRFLKELQKDSYGGRWNTMIHQHMPTEAKPPENPIGNAIRRIRALIKI